MKVQFVFHKVFMQVYELVGVMKTPGGAVAPLTKLLLF